MADSSSSNTAVVAIVILVIAALVFFYFMFVRASSGGDEPDIQVELPDKQGAMAPEVEVPPVYFAEMHLA